MKLCYKCGKRPAVVFITEMNQNGVATSSEPKGLCLVCAKEAGIQPINEMLEKMNISDEDIEQMSDQFMDIMSMGDENGEDDYLGAAPAFPIGNLFGGFPSEMPSNKSDSKSSAGDEKGSKDEKRPHSKRRKFIEQYCTNLTEKAKNGELDVIVGRENELYRTIQILSRRTKNNPCLIGEPGVGKTAIAEGLALMITNKTAPARLLDKEIHLLDLTGLVAGTQFRGQFESRIKGLIEEVKEAKNIILFIDEIHNLVGTGDAEGSMNAANILKPALSRGEIQVIGATTFNEYRKYIEKDAALERRFQPVTINEPSISDAIKVLSGVKPYYEGYHNVKFDDSLIPVAVRMSERYITDRFLPDKAIDLMDEASACACLRNKSIDELHVTNSKIADLLQEQEKLEANLNNPDYERIATVKSELEVYKNKANTLYAPAADNNVTIDDLAKVIELWTGIPATKVKADNLQKLEGLEENIKKHIVGQDDAVSAVVAGVRRSTINISSHKRPASFIFVGPTGVGKTELVKVLSKELFDSPETLIRLDMTEYMEKHSVSKLIGAPPGYVGYDEAGQLTEKIRRKPYSVILFDEIEKAHPDVLNILLQVLDDGRITDAQGRTVNFENAIIVMTSNAGSDNSENLLGFGRTATEATKDKAMKALSEFLRPEFLGRVDDIVVFRPLNKNDFVKIAELMCNELSSSLADKGIGFEIKGDVYGYIADLVNTDKRGAREIRNVIRKEIEDKIVSLIIENGEGNIKAIIAEVKKGVLQIFSK